MAEKISQYAQYLARVVVGIPWSRHQDFGADVHDRGLEMYTNILITINAAVDETVVPQWLSQPTCQLVEMTFLKKCNELTALLSLSPIRNRKNDW